MAKNSSCLAPNQLQTVSIFLLWHKATPGTVKSRNKMCSNPCRLLYQSVNALDMYVIATTNLNNYKYRIIEFELHDKVLLRTAHPITGYNKNTTYNMTV